MAIPTWWWLSAIVLLSAAIRFDLALDDPAPWIFQDELLYSELAKSFAATGTFAVRDVPGAQGFGVVYSILISPAYWLYQNVTDAYEAIKAINAVLMSLAAVPTYLLARRVLGRGLALVAAALAVAVPSMVYTSTVMTEVAFYPITLTFVLCDGACARTAGSVAAGTRARFASARVLHARAGSRLRPGARDGHPPRRAPRRPLEPGSVFAA